MRRSALVLRYLWQVRPCEWTLPLGNVGTALRQRRCAFEELKFPLEKEFGCGIRPAVKPQPVRSFNQSPRTRVLGLLFVHFSGHFLSIYSRMNAA